MLSAWPQVGLHSQAGGTYTAFPGFSLADRYYDCLTCSAHRCLSAIGRKTESLITPRPELSFDGMIIFWEPWFCLPREQQIVVPSESINFPSQDKGLFRWLVIGSVSFCCSQTRALPLPQLAILVQTVGSFARAPSRSCCSWPAIGFSAMVTYFLLVLLALNAGP